MSNIKNYAKQGGENWVIGGSLEVTAEGKLTLQGVEITRAGVQADSVATTIGELKTDFNSLLAKLKAAGLMALE